MNRVLIFDFDGVIVDSLDVFMKIVSQSCRKINPKLVISKKEFLKLFEKNFYDSIRDFGIVREKFPTIFKDIQIDILNYQNKIHLFKGIKKVLKELAKNSPIIIISSNITKVVKSYLRSQSFKFIKIIIGADKATSKIEKINYIKLKYPRSEIFYIGDTKGDVIEGRRAGVKTVAVTWGWHSQKKLREGGPDYIIDSPKELLNLFKKI